MPHIDEAALAASVYDDLQVKVRASFLILMQTCVHLGKKVDGEDRCLFDDLRQAVTQTAMTLESLPTLGEPERLARCEALTQHKSEILSVFKQVDTIKSYYRLLHEWVQQDIFLSYTDTAPVFENGYEVLSAHLDSVISKEDKKDIRLDEELMSRFMSYIPLRMTGARYNDYVADAFRKMDYECSLSELDYYKSLFCPMGEWVESTRFSEVKQTLDTIWQTEITQCAPEDVHAFQSQLDTVRDRLIHFVSYTDTLYDAFNAADILTRFGGQAGLWPEDAETQALYETFKALITESWPEDKQNDFEQQLDETILKTLDHVQFGPDEDAFEDTAPDALENGPLKQWHESWQHTHKLFYASGLEYFYGHGASEEDTGGDSAKALVAALQAYRDTCTAGLPVKRKRFLRQHFLRYLPYPYDIETYKKYFTDTFDSLDNTGRALIFMYIALTDKAGRYNRIFESSENHEDSNL